MTKYRTIAALVALSSAAIGIHLVRAQTQAPVAPAAPSLAGTGVTYTGELTQGGWIRGTAPRGALSVSLDGQPLPLDADRTFFAAFDRDAGRSAQLSVTFAGGVVRQQVIAISARAWQIENVNIARSPGGPTEAFMAIRRPELARIDAARAKVTDAQGWRQKFAFPAKGRISGRFGAQRVYRGEPGAYHSGLDIAGTTGTPFYAPADGVVILAAQSPFTLEGNLLMIDHGMGLNSAFLHCSAILVKEGEHVRQGQLIGKIGATGRATGPHLHWSIKWRDARLDPLLFTGPMG